MRDGVEDRRARNRRRVVAGIVLAVLVVLLVQTCTGDGPPSADLADTSSTETRPPIRPIQRQERKGQRDENAPRPGVADSAPAPDTGAPVPLLSVRVRDSGGAPLPDACVALDGPDLSIRTKVRSPDGTIYEFRQTPRTPCELIVRHPAHLPHVRTLASFPDRPIDVVLRRGGSLTGRVMDGSGSGVAGARVLGLGPRSGGIWRDVDGLFAGDSLPDHVETTTRADGTFTLSGFRETTYFVTASKDGLVPSPLPSATRPQSRRAGDHVEILLLPTYVLRARFVDAVSGEPVPVARLDFGATTRYDGAPGRSLRAGGNPQWRDGLSRSPPPVGTLIRHLQAHDTVAAPTWVAEVASLFYESRSIRVPLRLVPSDEETVVELTPRSGPRGRLVVRLADAAAAPLLGSYNLLLRPVDARRWSNEVVEFDEAGTAERDLPPGRYAWSGDLLRHLDLPTDGSIEIRANERTELRLDLPASRLALPRLRVVDAQGTALRDYQWRIQGPGSSPADRRAGGRVRGEGDPRKPIEDLRCVPAGECVVHVFKAGYRPFAKTVVLPAGGRLVIDVVLELDE